MDEAKKILYLKGSSGSGKSTLMRKVATTFEEKGIEVDYIHCSNSVDDLDGICIREKGISLVDATAPHICDPRVPVAIDEIFNLADFIDRNNVRKHAEELLKLQIQKKPYYHKAYSYLNAACKIYENNIYMYQQSLNQVMLKDAMETEIKPFFLEKLSARSGFNRSFFASAVSPQGMVSYLDSLVKDMTIVALKGESGMGMDQMLLALRDTANSRGYYTESCLCTLNTEKIDHLLIPEKKLAYITFNQYHTTEEKIHRVIDFEEFCDMESLKDHRLEIQYNQKIFEELLEKSMNMMDAQKVVHDKIEKLYINNIDFAGLDQAFYKILDIIQSSIQE
ncbi:MAG TPA: hypothetical protein IAC41_00960 [Candidatus Merdenecus merdavium]|nr:hypothetical protein [Candidatus Merdenecus merdavium]